MGLGIDDIGNALGDVARAGVSLATGDVDGARNHLSDADSAITGDTTNSDIAAADARRQHDAGVGERQRDELGAQQAALSRGVHGGFDGRAVTSFENYAAFDHPELYAKAQEMSSSGSQDAATGWTDLGTALGGHFEALGQSLSSAIANGWEGEGASVAAATSARYVRQASALQPAFALTGSKLQEAASGVGQTNATLPPPVEFNRTHAVVHGVVSVLTGGAADADVKAQQGAMDAAHAEAVQVMESTYKPVMVSADSGVPTFAAPSSPTTGGLAPTQPPVPGDPRTAGPTPWFPQTRTGGSGPTGGGPNGGSIDGSTGSQPRVGQIAPMGTPTAGSGGPGDGTGSGSGGYGEPTAAVSSAGYTAPGFGSGSGYGGAGHGAGSGAGYGSAGFGGAGDAAGYGAGGFGGTGSGARGGSAGLGGAGGSGGSRGVGGTGGYSSGSYGSGGSGSGTSGSSGLRGGGALGGGTGATGAGPGVGAAGGAAGATGGGPGTGTSGVAGSGSARSGAAGGMGGGMGGGRGGRGEEDYEHNTPSYLISDDNGSEIVGKLPPVAPAVIGE